MAKYTIGDKVTIRKDLDANTIYGCFRPNLETLLKRGSVATIAFVDYTVNTYRILEDQGHHWYTEEMFEAPETFEFLENIEVSDNGEGWSRAWSFVAVVKDKYLVVGNTDEGVDTLERMYNENEIGCSHVAFYKYARKIQKPAAKKMTVEEITKALGYEVEIIKG